MTAERVDTLLVAAGFVLVVGTSLFAGRIAWRLADRAVDWIATHRPLRDRRSLKGVSKARPSARRVETAAPSAAAAPAPAPAPAATEPAPLEQPAPAELAAARAAALKEQLLGVEVARHTLLRAALHGDRHGAAHAQHALRYHAHCVETLQRGGPF